MSAPRPNYWCHILSDQSQGNSTGDLWADWLERELADFAIPAKLAGRRNLRGEVIPAGRLPVCVTKSRKDPSATIDDDLADRLDRSLNLVVLCSPWATRSPLVDQVVRTYKMSGRSNRLLAAIIAGIPHANGEQAAQECFPAATRFNVDEQGELLTTPAEPIAADFRTADGGEGWTDPEAYLEVLQEGGTSEAEAERLARAYEERLRLMKLKIVAGVLGVSLGELTERDLAHQQQVAAQRNRQAAIRYGLIGLIGVVGLAAGGLAWRSHINAAHSIDHAKQESQKDRDARLAIEQAKQEAERTRLIQLNEEAIRLLGENTPASLAQAKVKLLEAAEQGPVQARYNLGRLLLDQKDPAGIKWLKLAAEQGNPEANNYLGICHLNRLFGQEGGLAEASRLFQVAAGKDYAPAMINLGLIAERGAPGLGGARGAAQWYERAGNKGEGMGWFKLYQFLSVGREELTRDVGAALTYLRQAAELGHPEAQWTLGHLLLKGRGMPADGQAAVNWFSRLTQQRTDPRFADLGRIELAKMYRDGQLKKSGTEGGDRALAISIFTQLAERGNASAAFQLGETYGDPRSPVADEATAARWYRKSAELGSDEGQLHMSRRLIEGLTQQLAFHAATRWLNSREGLPPTDHPYPNLLLDPRHGVASVAADRQAAEQWLTAVARSNSEHRNRARVALAEFLLRRDLHPTDRFPEALEALQQAAADKDALALAMLAELYAEGRPPQLTADPAKAAELRELSLTAGRPEARDHVLRCAQDRARRAAAAAKIAPDYVKAMQLAAQRGHPQALIELGLHHLHFGQVEDTPLPLDPAKAAQNLTPGALAGDSLALMGLGLTYQKTKDLPNRFRLHLKAANNGDQPLAQLWVGAACEQGLGTAVDLVEADKWYQLAAKQKQEGSAEGRRRIEAQMSAEQLVEARRRADVYQPLKAPVAESAPANLPR